MLIEIESGVRGVCRERVTHVSRFVKFCQFLLYLVL